MSSHLPMISDINLLKTCVSDLRRDVHQLRIDGRKPVSQASSKLCFLYVKLNVNDLSSIGASLLESVLSCNILGYWIIRSSQKPVLKVKIFESNLLTALTCGNRNGHHASIWQKDTLLIPNRSSPQQPPTEYTKSINLLSWNCRGLSSNVPYIQSLLCGKP